MVRIIIDTKYLHYKQPSMDIECKVQGEGSFAYCDFLPEGGLQCNVISWKCLDIKYLDIREKYHKDFYHRSMKILRKYQEAEKKCLDNVKDEIEGIKNEYYNILQKSFSYFVGLNPAKVASQKSLDANRGTALQIYQDDYSGRFPDILQDIVFGLDLLMVYVSGGSICHDSELVIPLLPIEGVSVKLVGLKSHVVIDN